MFEFVVIIEFRFYNGLRCGEFIVIRYNLLFCRKIEVMVFCRYFKESYRDIRGSRVGYFFLRDFIVIV